MVSNNIITATCHKCGNSKQYVFLTRLGLKTFIPPICGKCNKTMSITQKFTSDFPEYEYQMKGNKYSVKRTNLS